MPKLRVFFLPELIDENALPGSRAVVVDVLRATTTVVTALASGAEAVVPCLTIDDARRRAAESPAGKALLGGERGGLPIDGFQLGNSPAEYTSAAVGGKSIVLTTTNGTKALLRCTEASEVLLGALVNLSTICVSLQKGTTDAAIVCAGTDGHVTREDVLFAGAVADRLGRDTAWQLDDSAQLARDAWQTVAGGATGETLQALLVDALRQSRGGQNLVEIGMAADILLAAEVNRYAIVPRYDAEQGRIKAMP